MNGGDVQIATFDRGEGERLVVALREFNGAHFVDARIQFKNDRGEWLPTKKGVAIKLREIWNFHDAIGRACELAKGVRK